MNCVQPLKGWRCCQPLVFGAWRHAASETKSRIVTSAGLLLAHKYPPFCADIGSMPLKALAVRVRAFCVWAELVRTAAGPGCED
jgi:hypothetical protein